MISRDVQCDNLPAEIRPLEKLVCKVYSKLGPQNIPQLRWELFRTQQREGEMLPPTRGAFLPHVMRVNYVTMRDKSYISACPTLLPIDKCGWYFENDILMPVQSFLSPAPKAVIELVKCTCAKGCTRNCGCRKTSYHVLLYVNATAPPV